MIPFTEDDFPITALGHNVYRRNESSPICTCIVKHRTGRHRATVVYYWANEWGYSPSDSCRWFWH